MDDKLGNYPQYNIVYNPSIAYRSTEVLKVDVVICVAQVLLEVLK